MNLTRINRLGDQRREGKKDTNEGKVGMKNVENLGNSTAINETSPRNLESKIKPTSPPSYPSCAPRWMCGAGQ